MTFQRTAICALTGCLSPGGHRRELENNLQPACSLQNFFLDRGQCSTFPTTIKYGSGFRKAFSEPGDAVFDPFLGNGTTLFAAAPGVGAFEGSDIRSFRVR